MKLNDLCSALCSGLALREVKIGYAIKTPFKLPDGDSIALYIRRDLENPRMLRFEDDGGTIAALEEDGVSLESEARSDAFSTAHTMTNKTVSSILTTLMKIASRRTS
jgi:hypothetical protein